MDASYVRPLSESIRRPHAETIRVDPALTAWAVLACAAFIVCTGLMLHLAKAPLDDIATVHHFSTINRAGMSSASDIDPAGNAFAFAGFNNLQYVAGDNPILELRGRQSAFAANSLSSAHCVRISPTGNVLAVGGLVWGAGGVLELWSLDQIDSDKSAPATLNLGTAEIVRTLAFSPRGDILVAGTRRQDGKGARLVFINPATGAVLKDAGVPESEITALCFPAGSQNGEFLFAAGSASGAGNGRLCRSRLDGEEYRIETVAQYSAVVTQIDTTPDERLIALATSDGVIRVLRPDATDARAAVTRSGKNVSALCIDATSGDVYFAEWDVAALARTPASPFGPRYEFSIQRLAFQDAAPRTIWQGRGDIGRLRYNPSDGSLLAADLSSGKVVRLIVNVILDSAALKTQD
jgi:hypothetical protein